MEEEKKPEADIKQEENKTPPPAAAVTTEIEETQEQINWRRFREAREIDRKQKIEAERRAAEKEAEAQALKAALEAVVNKPSPANSHQINEISDEPEDQKIRRLVAESLEAERRKNQIEQQKKEQEELPKNLKKAFADFDKVCTVENLDYLEYHYPEISNAFRHMPDNFDKWSSVYQAVKRFLPNPESKKEQSKAEKNLTKPQAMSIPGKTPTGDSAPHSLDEKRKADNWQRMQRVMRGG